MHNLYIGKNKTWTDHLNTLLKSNMFSMDTPFKARAYIFENWYNTSDPIFIFIECTEIKTTTKHIVQLKKNKFPNQYLLLVGENIPRESLIHYIKSGINEVIAPDIASENLHHLLSLLPLIHLQAETGAPIQTFHLPLWKRTFDLLFASCALLGLSPLLLLTALAIRLESSGPVIYTSQRVGSNYKIFGFLKFRSMYKNADKRLKEFKELNQYQEEDVMEESITSELSEKNSAIFIADDFHLTESEFLERRKKLKENNFIKLKNDPRITQVGHIIRKYSIDELPQFINILKGDMSIVGNRPLPLYEAEQLTSDEYIERFMAPSGLTGLWQVEKRGTEGILSPEERKQLDIQYSRKFSFWFDLKIILRTFTAFIQKENV